MWQAWSIVALSMAGCMCSDELKIPGRWPTDLASTLDAKAVVLVGGPAMGGGGKIDLFAIDASKILKTAALPDTQSAASVVIVPYNGSARGAALVTMDTQMLGVADSVYLVSLEDATFGDKIWSWMPPKAYGTFLTSHNGAVGKDGSGRYIYVASGSSQSRADKMYSNSWWLHVLDISGMQPKLAQTVELPSYVAKSWYNGFGVFPSPEGHVLVNSNMAGVPGAPVVLVESAATSPHVRNITLTLNGETPAYANILAWDSAGKGFFADYSFWNKDQTKLRDVHIHYDLKAGVVASSDIAVAEKQVSHEYYGKGVLTPGGQLYYPTYSNGGGGLISGLVASFDASTLKDSWSREHFSVSYWPKAVAVAGGKLWVAWQCANDATLNTYSLPSESNFVVV